ncbi:DUF3152 domain-containing protein [Streptomyces sp. NPDC090025]|uniref:DUF3152 domain-containing protein n=1 Tax=Streptomyces sp. NPDC090025 TaxID=3365922 RepID=UPI003832DC8C
MARSGTAGRRRRGGAARRRRSLLMVVLGLIVVALGGGAALAQFDGLDGLDGPDALGAAADTPTPTPPAASGSVRTPKPTPTPPPTTKPKPKPKPTPGAAHRPVRVLQRGAGTFTTAEATGAPVGSGGALRRYQVQVENGVDISARDAAVEIQAILAHPRGWAAHGRGRFQLVTDDADFVIRIATPDTADKLCAVSGLRTRGELNCETSAGVVVNLKRWTLGSPTFAGPPTEYRHLIINHEVGHEIGLRRHLGCAGPGKAAPVMMQQIKGLNGCRSNAYPYDEDGGYITGPIVS